MVVLIFYHFYSYMDAFEPKIMFCMELTYLGSQAYIIRSFILSISCAQNIFVTRLSQRDIAHRLTVFFNLIINIYLINFNIINSVILKKKIISCHEKLKEKIYYINNF